MKVKVYKNPEISSILSDGEDFDSQQIKWKNKVRTFNKATLTLSTL